MKKFIIVLLAILALIFVGCSSSKSIYDDNKSINDPGTDYNDDYSDPAKNFYPDYALPEDNENTKDMNNDIDNYFKGKNITDYDYTTSGSTMRVWINDWDNMADNTKTTIKNDLKRFNKDVKDIIFVKNKDDLK